MHAHTHAYIRMLPPPAHIHTPHIHTTYIHKYIQTLGIDIPYKHKQAVHTYITHTNTTHTHTTHAYTTHTYIAHTYTTYYISIQNNTQHTTTCNTHN